MERCLGARVYLGLQVKVRTAWRDAANVLDLIEGLKKRTLLNLTDIVYTESLLP